MLASIVSSHVLLCVGRIMMNYLFKFINKLFPENKYSLVYLITADFIEIYSVQFTQRLLI